MFKRLGQTLGIALLAAMMLGADAGETRFSRLGHQMMCVCSCGQILLECNHVGCLDSDRMIGELRDQLASGSADKSILDWFTAKYGATVLAAPIRGGFDTVAWVAPAVLFLLAGVGVGFVIRSWTKQHRRTPSAAEVWSPQTTSSSYHATVRRETEM